MDKKIETTTAYSYENKGVTLAFSLKGVDNGRNFIELLEQAILDIKETYEI